MPKIHVVTGQLARSGYGLIPARFRELIIAAIGAHDFFSSWAGDHEGRWKTGKEG
jgi:hypothetical protein